MLRRLRLLFWSPFFYLGEWLHKKSTKIAVEAMADAELARRKARREGHRKPQPPKSGP